MKLHRNAKTTPQMRALMIERVTVHGWTQMAHGRGRRRERPDGGQMDGPPPSR